VALHSIECEVGPGELQGQRQPENEVPRVVTAGIPIGPINAIRSKGLSSKDAKVAAAVVLVATEDEAIEKLKTREYWIRMTFNGNKAPQLNHGRKPSD
jgi:hypothetical protein